MLVYLVLNQLARITAQSTSGRRSSGFTAPFVAFTMDETCATSIFAPSSHFTTAA
nr:MAG TPA: hypothetical protein [Bacteriophage sp.]